jgi:hypothetical protein
MRRTLATVAVLWLSLLGGAACGEDDDAGNPTQDPKVIEITFEGDTVTPAGDRVNVDVGQTVELVVKADAAGEIHVHSDPEQELSYGEATTTLTLTIDEPGIVDVESHDLEQVIVQLEVE